MVVVDEIHMVAEANRGYLLEVIFSKIRYILRNNVQCIGLSATLPNISDIAAWLEASLYTTEYRPVNLTTRICQNGMLYRLNEEHINETTSLLSLDRILPHHDRLTKEQHNDSVYSLCLETIGIKKSILIFCSSKSFCETYAQKLAGTLVCKESNNITEIDTMRLNIINGLRQTSVGLCPILRHTIRSGVAYHHAGLTTDERTIIENGFRSGAILVLCATSTLAAGVNLPAHRVIIRCQALFITKSFCLSLSFRSPYMVKNPLSIANFRQMCGRAGRLGLDENGEAILIIRNDSKVDADLALKLMTAPIEPTLSSLNAFNGRGLVKLLLEMICCGRLSHESAVMEFISFTLMNLQHAAEEVRTFTTVSIT
jgi:replicative superfamily II helicase